ncbi:MAG: SpoIIE family protein phosphatase [Rhodothermia bacterium]|nr:SpoIIE family protein phosphatase [Rhodothermia bacterium]
MGLRSLNPRTLQILLGLLVLGLFSGTIFYHIHLEVWNGWNLGWLDVLAELGVAATFGLAYQWMSDHFQTRKLGPIRALWSLTLVILGVVLLSALFGLHYEKGMWFFSHKIPDRTIPGVLVICGMALLQGLGGAFLLVQLRELVLFKRTSVTVRNWNMLLWSLAGTFAAVVLVKIIPIPYVVEFAIVFTGATILINVFRLSWVAYLPFRQKLIGLAVSLVMLIVLLAAFGEAVPMRKWGFIIWEADPFVAQYSFALNLTLTLTLILGILYSVTTLLSLIFHLPTSGDFQRKSDDLAAMRALTQIVGQVFDTQHLPKLVLDAVRQFVGEEQMAWLALSDVRTGTLRPQVAAMTGLTEAQLTAWMELDAFYSELQSRREPLVLNHAVRDHRIHTPGYEIGSLAMMPLITRNELIGALFVAKTLADGFDEDDAKSLGAFADQVALAIDNARLFEERIEKERLGRELAIARDVQKRLLPNELPRIPGASLFASYEFAHEVGGDYFDFVQADNNRYSFIIGDVSGKGTSAAFYMAALKGTYHALARSDPDPRTLLLKANEALSVQKEKNIFITAIAGLLDTASETITLLRAGHSPAIHIDLHGQVRMLREGGLGLGLANSAILEKTFVPITAPLRPGDVFVLYTDGVIESRNAAGESYGYERLIETLQKSRQEDAVGIHDALLADLNRFTGDLRYFDDLTLIVLKWHGQSVRTQV